MGAPWSDGGAEPVRLSWECASGWAARGLRSGVRAPVRCCRTGQGFCSYCGLVAGQSGASARASSPRWATGSARISSTDMPSARSSCIRRQALVPLEAARPDVARERRDELELGDEHRAGGTGSRQEELGQAALRASRRTWRRGDRISIRSRSARSSSSRATSSGGSPGMRDSPASSDMKSRTGVDSSSASQSSNSSTPASVIAYTVRSGRLPSRVVSCAAIEAVLLQRLDDGVQRAVVELDALLLAAGAQGRGDLVGMHRPLGQAAEHGQRERVGHSASGHGTSSIRNGVSGTEYVPSRPHDEAGRTAPRGADPAGRCRVGLPAVGDVHDDAAGARPLRVKTRNGSRARTPRPKLVTPSNEPTWATCRNVQNPDTSTSSLGWPGGRPRRACTAICRNAPPRSATGRPDGSSVTAGYVRDAVRAPRMRRAGR